MVLLNTSKIGNSVEISWLDEKFNIHYKSYEIKRLHRIDIEYAVYEEYNWQLDNDISTNGMHSPLIAIPNSKANWEEAAGGLKHRVPFNPYAIALIVYGNQRLRILEKMKIENDIPVVIADNHVDAIILYNTFKYRE